MGDPSGKQPDDPGGGDADDPVDDLFKREHTLPAPPVEDVPSEVELSHWEAATHRSLLDEQLRGVMPSVPPAAGPLSVPPPAPVGHGFERMSAPRLSNELDTSRPPPLPGQAGNAAPDAAAANDSITLAAAVPRDLPRPALDDAPVWSTSAPPSAPSEPEPVAKSSRGRIATLAVATVAVVGVGLWFTSRSTPPESPALQPPPAAPAVAPPAPVTPTATAAPPTPAPPTPAPVVQAPEPVVAQPAAPTPAPPVPPPTPAPSPTPPVPTKPAVARVPPPPEPDEEVVEEPLDEEAIAAAAAAEKAAAEEASQVIAAARAKLGADDAEGAELLVRQLLVTQPRNHHAMELLARALIDQDRGDEAATVAGKLVKLRSGRLQHWLLYGDALLMRGDEAGAEKAWRKALELGPADPGTKQRLGLK